MFKTFLRAAAIAVAILIASYPQTSFADGFTAAEFLDWPAANQKLFIETSVLMSAVIASQNNQDVSRCVSAWHVREKPSAFSPIMKALRENRSFHPQAVILAVLQKACGSFVFGR